MTRSAIFALFGLFFCSVVPAHADWIQAETDNFLFLGDVGENDALEVLNELEIYRSTILALTNTAYFSEVRKVRVFGFRKSSNVRDIVGRSRILGAYTQGNDYPIIVTVISGGSKNGLSVVLHEYAHHVLNGLTADYYPSWYNEGFAEFLASFDVDDGIVTIGKPSSEFGTLLDRPRWTDIETVLSSVTNYPFDSSNSRVDAFRNALFYGVCWIAVHYLQNTPELNSGFSNYIGYLNSGTDPLIAFEQGFGIAPEEFGKRLHQYWRADAFPVIQFRMTDSFAVSKSQITNLADDEAEISIVMAKALFASSESNKEREREKIRRNIGKLLEKHKNAVSLYYALMTLELRESDYDAAVAAGERSLEIAPDDPLAVETLADALFHRYKEDGMKHATDLSRARSLFRKQLEVDSGNPTANRHYPQTILLEQLEPDELSLNATDFNLRIKSSPIYTGIYLDSAELFSRAGRTESACSLLGRIDTWVRSLDIEMTEENRAKIRRQDQETELERLNRIKAELGDNCL